MQKTEWQSVLYAYVLIKLYIKIAPCLFWEKGCSCSFDRRLVSCILFSFHRIASLDGLPCHHFHVCLLVLSVKESDGTKARVCLNKLQMSGFGHHGTPYGPFIFIARNGRMDRCGIASRNCSDRNISVRVKNIFVFYGIFIGAYFRYQYLFFLLDLLVFAIFLNFARLASRYRLLSAA